MTLLVLQQVFVLSVLILIGFILGKIGFIKAEQSGFLTGLLKRKKGRI